MFTGLIEATGRIERIEDQGRDRRLRIALPPERLCDLQSGESISVAGVCLTAVEPDAQGFTADVSAQTLAHTSLGRRATGDRVNLERALLPTTRLGGHLVSGHVDDVAETVGREADGQSWRFRFRVAESLVRYIAPFGSICVDGISLTVTAIEGDVFTVNIVPHTLAETTLGDTEVGAEVNIEIDLIARYLERLSGTGTAGRSGSSGD